LNPMSEDLDTPLAAVQNRNSFWRRLSSVTLFVTIVTILLSVYFYGPYYRFFFNDPIRYTGSALYRTLLLTPQSFFQIAIVLKFAIDKNRKSFSILAIVALLVGIIYTSFITYAINNS
ncbi:hypothetical protein, partial [Inquilinus sp. OTU3971]|uniref:hypothetical protein n=1 Tax=Inquilinus sp. OTU3971 TaxID=3043855 RepID=UPI00313D9CE4